MDAGTKTRRISNAYYNRGLAKAKSRDLYGAAADLKKSLRFYKYHTDARNLLGLIYHEIGEVGAAMTQWIISLNFQEQENLAEEYLRSLQATRGYLEIADQAAKKYNQALQYAQNDNEDLATLLLMRMVAEIPHYVKAQQLLALLCIHQEDYTKAGKCLYQALKIDRFNPISQRYMAVVKQNTGKAEVEKRKLKNAFSHRQMQDDDIIIPPSYKENTGWQSILNIMAGLVMGAVVIFFLVMPASRETMNNLHNAEMRKYLERINQLNIQIDGLEQDAVNARQKQQEAEASLDALLNDNGGTISQYQKLAKILEAYRNEDLQTAATLYVETDWELLKDGVLNDTVAWIQQDMAEQGHAILEGMGDAAASQAEGADQAIQYYEKSLLVKPDNPGVIFKIGMIYQSRGDVETAREYFGDVIMNYPDSEYAEQAKEQRGY